MDINLIISILNKNKNNGSPLNEIINEINPFLKYKSEELLNSNLNYDVKLYLLMNHMNEFIEKGYLLFNNNKYYINNNSEEFKKFIENENRFTEKLSIFNNNLRKLDNVMSGLDNIKIEQNNSFDSSEDIKESEDIEESEDEFNECYILKSLTNPKNDYYLINNHFTICSCRSYEFCKKEIKTCKHLNLIKDIAKNNRLNELPIYNIQNKVCSCNNHSNTIECEHRIYLKKYGY